MHTFAVGMFVQRRRYDGSHISQVLANGVVEGRREGKFCCKLAAQLNKDCAGCFALRYL